MASTREFAHQKLERSHRSAVAWPRKDLLCAGEEEEEDEEDEDEVEEEVEAEEDEEDDD